MFDWDDANVEHIARHGIEPWEVEEAMTDPERLKSDAYTHGGERRSGVLGATTAGRILLVIYTTRGRRYRPVTARDANPTQKRRYRR